MQWGDARAQVVLWSWQRSVIFLLFPFVYRNAHILYKHNSKPTIIGVIIDMSEIHYIVNVYSQG